MTKNTKKLKKVILNDLEDLHMLFDTDNIKPVSDTTATDITKPVRTPTKGKIVKKKNQNQK